MKKHFTEYFFIENKFHDQKQLELILFDFDFEFQFNLTYPLLWSLLSLHLKLKT